MNNATLIDNKRGNGIREGGLFQPHSCSSRRSRACCEDEEWIERFFLFFFLFLLRGNVIFKRKSPKYSRFAHEVTPSLLRPLYPRFRNACSRSFARCENNLYALGTFKKLSVEDHFSCSCLFCYGRSPR